MPSGVGDRLARAGVLGLQGDFREHIDTFQRLGTDAVDVRRPEQLDDIDALVIPGGESTTIGKLALHYGFIPKLKERVADGMAVWGTCAGAIFIARDVPGHPHPLAELMDITVRRNAFGRQLDSFEADLDVPALGADPFHAVFIRAPLIEAVGDGVEVVSRLADGTIVAARQDNLLATSFHPELTHDGRFHDYFLKLGRH
ncbi:MAG: pyridoxal 5'-phosphate synthase glutaminase subunit PdxT [Chloroflexota bacterium]|nr:pyridoxal 5'-phosphate synthase glutaminase subunit PdxT [Chloroflexota bacterium]